MKKGLTIFGIILLIAVALGTAYTQYTYSEGVRAGVLMRFAKKGYIVKTHEGQLSLNVGVIATQNNALANSFWYFTVKDESVAQKLSGLEGKKVQLHYKQIIHQFWWQGQTPVFVDSVTVIDD